MAARFAGADSDVTPHEVLQRIEHICALLVEGVCVNGSIPRLRLPSRASANSQADLDGQVMRLGKGLVERSLTSRSQALPYTRVIRVLSACYKLLLEGRTATQRELYYQLVKKPFVTKSQESDASILDCASLLRVTRRDLALTASSKGLVHGRLLFRERGEVHDCRTRTASIPGDTEIIASMTFETDARAIIIVEKDAVFQTLKEDGFWGEDTHRDPYPAVLVTAKGMPDLATRAFVHRLHAAFPELPVLAVVDWNPGGVAILRTYRWGSARMGMESPAFALSGLKWLGFHASDLAAVEPGCFQSLTKSDASALRALRLHDGIKQEPGWIQELDAMESQNRKAEIEAAYTSQGFGSPGAVIKSKIIHQRWL